MNPGANPTAVEVSITSRAFVRTLLLTFVAIAALVIIDTFLASVERAEGRSEANHLFRQGGDLLAQGHIPEALDQFKNAATLERDNRDYQLGLAEALLKARRLDEAERSLAALLERDSTDGGANLAMARVLVAQSRNIEAESFYHRAIYGRWKTDSTANRVRVRFELVDLLLLRNAKEDALAELLPLQEEAPGDLETRKRIGRLFTSAGSSTRAAVIFREVLSKQPQDAEAYAGIGEAEFARGSYRAAQINLNAALRLAPDNEAVRKRLAVINLFFELDPMQRGLAQGEKYVRSVRLLEMTNSSLKACVQIGESPLAPDITEAAEKAIHERVPFSREPAVTEEVLNLAEKIWNTRKNCRPATSAAEEALALVLEKLTQ